MQRRALRTLAVLFTLAVTGFASMGSASAATKLVSFDDIAAGTAVDEQYRASHGVFFIGQADAGFKPVVRSAAGKARSGDRVADLNTCVGGVDACGEFGVNGRARGRLTTSASAISVYVGFLDQAPDPGGTATLRLRGF